MPTKRITSATNAAPVSRLISPQEAAKSLGVPYTSFRDWLLKGLIPSVRAPGSSRMWVERTDVDAAIDKWKASPSLK